MHIKSSLFLAVVLILSFSPKATAQDHKDDHKKSGSQRGMLEKMEAVPCGAKQRGLNGVGSVFASAGVEHSSSTEKMCAQYLLRTDEMEYHVRPTDGKHPAVLPVGHEAEFTIKNDRMFLKIPDGDRKVRTYEVVAMVPLNSDSSAETPDEKELSIEKKQLSGISLIGIKTETNLIRIKMEINLMAIKIETSPTRTSLILIRIPINRPADAGD